MKKISMFAMLMFSLLLWTRSFGQEQAPAPVYKDGDCWQFRAKEGGFVYTSSSIGVGQRDFYVMTFF